jgi:tRNA (guanine-N7-)-methyltransferase
MIPGAELRLATDDPSYLPWMIEHACTHPAFSWLAERPADWRERPADWPPTRYERKMLAGHRPVFLRLVRR